MSEERDRLEHLLDEAFQSLRPRAGYEDELLARVTSRATPAAQPLRGPGWWTWAGAAAAVLVVALLGLFAVPTLLGRPAGGGTSERASRYSGASNAPLGPAAQAPRELASFGRLPRPPATAPLLPPGAGQALGAAPGSGGTVLVARYQEPSEADVTAFAQSLGASGQGGRFTGPGLTLLVYPTDVKTGLQAHYLLNYERTPPPGPVASEAAARSAATSFLAGHGLQAPGGVTGVSTEGPFTVVRYASEFGAALDVYVGADGAVYQASGPLPARYERAAYPAASPEQLRAAAGAAAAGAPANGYALVFDAGYGYYEPVVAFTAPGGSRTVVPAVDPAQLR